MDSPNQKNNGERVYRQSSSSKNSKKNQFLAPGVSSKKIGDEISGMFKNLSSGESCIRRGRWDWNAPQKTKMHLVSDASFFFSWLLYLNIYHRILNKKKYEKTSQKHHRQ